MDETCRALDVGARRDVVNVSSRCRVQYDGPMNARIVVKVVKVLLTSVVQCLTEVILVNNDARWQCRPIERVVHFDGEPVLESKFDVRGYVPFEGKESATMLGDVMTVDPDGRVMARAAHPHYQPLIPPRPWHPEFSLVPDITHVIAQARILSDVVVTGGNWHQDRVSELTGVPLVEFSFIFPIGLEMPDAAKVSLLACYGFPWIEHSEILQLRGQAAAVTWRVYFGMLSWLAWHADRAALYIAALYIAGVYIAVAGAPSRGILLTSDKWCWSFYMILVSSARMAILLRAPVLWKGLPDISTKSLRGPFRS